LTYPNGVQTTYAYDALNRLTALKTQTGVGGIVQSYVYTLGAAGNRARIEEYDGTIRSYSYDPLYRLTDETITRSGASVYSDVFGYDPVGNRLQQVHTDAAGTVTTTNATYDTRDRQLTRGAQTWTWDVNGNLNAKVDEAAYVWSFDDRLQSVTLNDGTVITHTYDADGARVRIETGRPAGTTATIDYLVDVSGALSQIIGETVAGALKDYYVVGDGGVLAVLRPDSQENLVARYYHPDAIGSTRALTDEAGGKADSYEYSAYGGLLDHEGSDSNAFLFAGESWNQASNLYFLRARWMDPRFGRFVSTDPFEGSILQPTTLHRYSYAANNPVNNTDPTGEETVVEVGVANLTLGEIAVHTGIGTLVAVCAIANLGAMGAGTDSPCGLRKPKEDDDEHEVTLYRGLNKTNPGAFRIDPDGISTFEYPSLDHNWNMVFVARYRGEKRPGTIGDIIEPIVIPGGKAVFTPQYGPGHWSLQFPGEEVAIKRALADLAKKLFL
jgi:RHS repeat-associated protein